MVTLTSAGSLIIRHPLEEELDVRAFLVLNREIRGHVLYTPFHEPFLRDGVPHCE